MRSGGEKRERRRRRLLLGSNGPERGAVKRSSTLLAVNSRCEEAGKKLIATIRLISGYARALAIRRAGNRARFVCFVGVNCTAQYCRAPDGL